jgi:pyruvyl transferase EpsO
MQHKKMLHLKSLLLQLNQIISTKKICYLDLPVYNNVGDLLIMRGTLKFFKLNHFVKTHCLTIFNFFPQAISDDDVIVFQGGGNFGDLHPAHQIFREKIIAQYPQHKIVVLPQTIFFENELTFNKTCALLKQHKNLHICVRDHHSFALAKKMTPNVYLLPDMAHYLYSTSTQHTLQKPLVKTLYINRTDKELADKPYQVTADQTSDWQEILGVRNNIIVLMCRFQQLLYYMGLNKYTADFTTILWLKYAQYITEYIVSKIVRFDVIHTSRLHGFILANLLNKQVYLINNSYGKNQHYFQTWFQN